jgi:hypothetical protein
MLQGLEEAGLGCLDRRRSSPDVDAFVGERGTRAEWCRDARLPVSLDEDGMHAPWRCQRRRRGRRGRSRQCRGSFSAGSSDPWRRQGRAHRCWRRTANNITQAT